MAAVRFDKPQEGTWKISTASISTEACNVPGGEFRERLADHVAKMVDDEYLQLESPDEGESSGSSPYL